MTQDTIKWLKTHKNACTLCVQVVCVVSRRAPRATTLIPLLSLSTVLACGFLVHFMMRCQRLSSVMQTREQELSRLLLKVLSLQDALQHHTRGRLGSYALRHSSLAPGFAVSAYMV